MLTFIALRLRAVISFAWKHIAILIRRYSHKLMVAHNSDCESDLLLLFIKAMYWLAI